ncbi:dishevelled egl-10 leckstrin domain protein, partial [Cystoisospora suis]
MSNQITVFTVAQCPFCTKAKSLLSELLVRVQGEGTFWSSTSPVASHRGSAVGPPTYSPTKRLSLRGGVDNLTSPSGLPSSSMTRRISSSSGSSSQPSQVLSDAFRHHGSTPLAFSSLPHGSLLGGLPPSVEEESGKWRLVEISLTDYPERRAELLQLCNSFSLPQIFFNNYRVGGWADLERLHNQGKLEALLNDCEDSFEYREAPPVSREAWEEKEVEKGHLRKREGSATPGRVPNRPFFDTPLSLYQRNSITGRAEEARRASCLEGGERRHTQPVPVGVAGGGGPGHPQHAPKESASFTSRFSIRPPLIHSLRTSRHSSITHEKEEDLSPSASAPYKEEDGRQTSTGDRKEEEIKGEGGTPGQRSRGNSCSSSSSSSTAASSSSSSSSCAGLHAVYPPREGTTGRAGAVGGGVGRGGGILKSTPPTHHYYRMNLTAPEGGETSLASSSASPLTGGIFEFHSSQKIPSSPSRPGDKEAEEEVREQERDGEEVTCHERAIPSLPHRACSLPSNTTRGDDGGAAQTAGEGSLGEEGGETHLRSSGKRRSTTCGASNRSSSVTSAVAFREQLLEYTHSNAAGEERHFHPHLPGESRGKS